MLAADTIPDVMMIGYRGDPADLYNLGATIDVDAELKTEKDWARQRADIFPGYLETSLWAGKMVAIPGHGTCQAMIYSPELLQKAGLTAPKDRWTWNDFLAMARKVAHPPDVWGLDLNWSYVFWAMWIGSSGARPLTKDNRRLTLNTPQVQEATTFLLDLVRGGVAPPESSAELIGKGQTAFEHVRAGGQVAQRAGAAGQAVRPLALPAGEQGGDGAQDHPRLDGRRPAGEGLPRPGAVRLALAQPAVVRQAGAGADDRHQRRPGSEDRGQ
jgi:ABC-type glycerol-3-phosphate transport system substrate-binding protein